MSHELQSVLERLIDEDILIPLAGIVMVVFIVGACQIRKVVTGNARERTKREIAAYIAEGSMTPEQGERLIRADEKRASM
ncbi:MAG: hypothetical protein AAFR38_08140 [Planctomycetota bacterium]